MSFTVEKSGGKLIFKDMGMVVELANENEIDIISILNKTKVSSDVLYLPPPNHIHRVTPKSKPMKVDYIEINISDVFDQCILETKVDILDSILIEPIPILSIRFPRIIKDGQKRKVFRKVIHDFMELNPNISYSHILKFINHINKKWYIYNDSSVAHVPEEDLEGEIITNNSYVLYYEKRPVSVIPSTTNDDEFKESE
jgi:hypothetical protein